MNPYPFFTRWSFAERSIRSSAGHAILADTVSFVSSFVLLMTSLLCEYVEDLHYSLFGSASPTITIQHGK
jgi:hypothetical protein